MRATCAWTPTLHRVEAGIDSGSGKGNEREGGTEREVRESVGATLIAGCMGNSADPTDLSSSWDLMVSQEWAFQNGLATRMNKETKTAETSWEARTHRCMDTQARHA